MRVAPRASNPRRFESWVHLGVAFVSAAAVLAGCRPTDSDPPTIPPTGICGNGVVEAGEQCDTEALAGADCLSAAGALDGQLACTPICTFDTSACHTCGDGDLEPAEQCEPGRVAADSCTELGLGQGSPYCRGDTCRLAGCYTCGDGVCSDLDGESVYTCVQDCGGWRDLALGAAHSCAVTQGGNVYCWGDHSAGQLGHGGRASPATPEGVWRVSDLVDAVRLAAGETHTCALTTAGEVWCWGRNDAGQLGLPPTELPQASVPVRVQGLPPASEIAAGAGHTCALTTAGEVWCWGRNHRGQLGDGTTTGRTAPAPVLWPDQASSIAASQEVSCAIRTDHTLWCWGANGLGQLGVGHATGPDVCDGTPCSTLPIIAVGLSQVRDVTLGGAHGCAVVQHRTGEHALRQLVCWGRNDTGQLGDTTTDPECAGIRCRPTPAPVSLDFQPAQVAAGASHTCAKLQDAHVWCWGAFDSGQLGRRVLDDGLRNAPPAPVDVAAVTGVHLVAAGRAHGCAVTSDRSLWCWGANEADQAAGTEDVCWQPEVLFDRIVR